MLKYRRPHLGRAGFIGVVVIMLVIAVGLQPERLIAWATTVRYDALFTEAGGLVVGDPVWMSGIKIGSVTDVSLSSGKIRATFAVAGSVLLGSETSAHIRTHTLLGSRMLTLDSTGGTRMHPGSTIPVAHTSSPYSLTEAVSDLTTNTAATDIDTVNRSLDALSATLDQISPALGPTYRGLTDLSRALNSRNETLRDLLKSAADVSRIVAERSEGLNTLILNANDLVGVLNTRREAIVTLLSGIATLARRLSGLVADNEKQLAPTLQRINSVTAMLEKNRDNIAKALPGLAKFQITQGEAVASGQYYNAFVANLLPGHVLQPFLDYVFGFRRGANNGQPPDNAGPRAEFPVPYNGIPGGSR